MTERLYCVKVASEFVIGSPQYSVYQLDNQGAAAPDMYSRGMAAANTGRYTPLQMPVSDHPTHMTFQHEDSVVL